VKMDDKLKSKFTFIKDVLFFKPFWEHLASKFLISGKMSLKFTAENFSKCLTLCLLYDLENIGSVYPAMSMIVIGHSHPII
jgi:hypothetical protein